MESPTRPVSAQQVKEETAHVGSQGGFNGPGLEAEYYLLRIYQVTYLCAQKEEKMDVGVFNKHLVVSVRIILISQGAMKFLFIVMIVFYFVHIYEV